MKLTKIYKPSDIILQPVIRDCKCKNISITSFDEAEYTFYVDKHNQDEIFTATWTSGGTSEHIVDGKIVIESEYVDKFSEGILLYECHLKLPNELCESDSEQDIYKQGQTHIFIKQ